jgi:hypothetical protein
MVPRRHALTPPVSTRDTKTNMSWYLYTHELIQKTIAAATETSGARGANTRPTHPMNSCIQWSARSREKISCTDHIGAAGLRLVTTIQPHGRMLTSRQHIRSRAAASSPGDREVCGRKVCALSAWHSRTVVTKSVPSLGPDQHKVDDLGKIEEDEKSTQPARMITIQPMKACIVRTGSKSASKTTGRHTLS